MYDSPSRMLHGMSIVLYLKEQDLSKNGPALVTLVVEGKDTSPELLYYMLIEYQGCLPGQVSGSTKQ